MTVDSPNTYSRSDLSVCQLCACAFVAAVHSEPVGPRHHQVRLRCPNCEWVRTGVFDQAEVDALDHSAAQAARQLRTALARARSWRLAESAQPRPARREERSPE